jgi:hypothetical protein
LADWLSEVRSVFTESRVIAATSRYRPHWQVLRSIPAGEDLADDFVQWAIGVMLDRQMRWPEFLEFAAKSLYARWVKPSSISASAPQDGDS